MNSVSTLADRVPVDRVSRSIQISADMAGLAGRLLLTELETEALCFHYGLNPQVQWAEARRLAFRAISEFCAAYDFLAESIGPMTTEDAARIMAWSGVTRQEADQILTLAIVRGKVAARQAFVPSAAEVPADAVVLPMTPGPESVILPVIQITGEDYAEISTAPATVEVAAPVIPSELTQSCEGK